MSEDARRTGDWDWVLDEINAVMSLHPEGNDTVPLRLARQSVAAFRGEWDEVEMANLARVLDLMSDPDVAISHMDIQASSAYVAGRWADAATIWSDAAALSDLNQPYVLPRAGHAFVLAGDDVGAEGTLQRLRALGTRGRAVDADRTSIAAGIAALRGDRADALAGYRTAIAAWRGLDLPWDEALTTLEAVTVLGTSDPEVAGWVDGARSTFERLRAAPLVDRLDEAVATASAQRAPSAATAATAESQV